MTLNRTDGNANALQILDVAAIAGRVRLQTDTGINEVIFETSLDTQRAEMDFS